jgi:hypothetical protein
MPADRTGRAAIQTAAAELRKLAIRDGYNGHEHPPVAFGMALTLDELARHVRDLDDGLREAVVAHCRALVERDRW